jgi:LuxR family transcriptional regulator, maltose regulon positive regulatory protein
VLLESKGAVARPRPSSRALPALPPSWIARDRLSLRVTDAVQSPLTVVTGPKGCGKTTLLSEWADHLEAGTVAWLSLDEADNDGAWFRRHLLGAFRNTDRSLLTPVVKAIEQHHSKPSEPRRVGWHLDGSSDVVLIMDDFHLVTNPDVIELVEYLLDHLPINIHVVLVGRTVPGLCKRQEKHTQVQVIDERDLRFTLDEAVAMFARANLRSIGLDEVEVLTKHTLGWATGLRLAAAVAVGSDDARAEIAKFSGNIDRVAEYFNHEVMTLVSAQERRFLAETSVLDVMTPGICEAVTGRADAGRLLDELVTRQLFVLQSNETQLQYLYHPLFLDFLKGRVQREMPAVIQAAHLRAATWFVAHGDPGAAVQHFVGAFSEHWAEQSPIRLQMLATGYLYDLRISEATGCLCFLEGMMSGHPRWESMRVRNEMLWSLRDGLLCDADGVLFHYRRAAELLASSPPAPPLSSAVEPQPDWLDDMDVSLRSELRSLAASAKLWREDPEGSVRLLQSDIRSQPASFDLPLTSVLANLAYQEGRLGDSSRLAQAALAIPQRQSWASSIFRLDSLLTLASVFFERDDLVSASGQLEQARSVCAHATKGRWRTRVECDVVRLMMAEGRPLEALHHLCDVRAAESDEALPEHIRQRLDQVELRCRLQLGDVEGALRILKYCDPEVRTPAMLARIDLSLGRPDRAAKRLSGAPSGAEPLRCSIERLLLLVRSYVHLGDERRVNRIIGQAIEAGRPGWHIRVFLEDLPELIGPLKRVSGQSNEPYFTALLSHATSLMPDPPPTSSGILMEFLTGREREVLGYLPSHLTQSEIARIMYVSPNTIKTHTKAIYRKLGASSRSNAVNLARSNGLIP